MDLQCLFLECETIIESGNTEKLKSLIASFPVLLSSSHSSKTLLQIAKEKNQLDIINFLQNLNTSSTSKFSENETHQKPKLLETSEITVPELHCTQTEQSKVRTSQNIKQSHYSSADLSSVSTFQKYCHSSSEFVQSSLEDENTTFKQTMNIFPRLWLDTKRTEKKHQQEEILLFLEKNKLKEYFKILIKNGFDHLTALKMMMKTRFPVSHFELNQIGITKSGDRSRLIVALESESELVNLTDKFLTISGFLEYIGLERYHLEFLKNGFKNLDVLIDSAFSPELTSEVFLINVIGMKKYGHRIRFIKIIQHLALSQKSCCCVM